MTPIKPRKFCTNLKISTFFSQKKKSHKSAYLNLWVTEKAVALFQCVYVCVFVKKRARKGESKREGLDSHLLMEKLLLWLWVTVFVCVCARVPVCLLAKSTLPCLCRCLMAKFIKFALLSPITKCSVAPVEWWRDERSAAKTPVRMKEIRLEDDEKQTPVAANQSRCGKVVLFV